MGQRPLYDGIGDAALGDQGHPGLWWERFFDAYPQGWDTNAHKEAWTQDKARWVQAFHNRRYGDADACAAACARQRRLCQALNGEVRSFRVDWHFVTGLGIPHPVENGFLWHPTLGTPYLPGSAVKGLVRTWVEAWMPLEDADRQALLYRWFGSEDKDPAKRKEIRVAGFVPPTRAKAATPDTEAGGFIFFDALPPVPPRLLADTLTPHLGKWYESGAERAGEPDTTPGDWHDPVPVPFLVASRPEFQFALAPRPGAADAAADLLRLVEALQGALEWLGAGAKTAVGYGAMQQAADAQAGQAREEVWRQVTLRYAKGQQQLSASGPGGDRGFVQGEEARKLHAARSGEDRKALDKGRLRADVRVRSLGRRNWRILGWVKPTREGNP